MGFLCLLTACAAPVPTRLALDSVARERPGDASRVDPVNAAEAARGVIVSRRGVPLPITLPLALETGDEIRVESPYIATIVFPGGHEAVVLSDTRLRLGSILDLVGRVIVRARGIFRVETEYVTAGVKGTEFWVEATPDQVASAGVISGSITVSSRVGRWAPVDVQEGEAVTADRDQPPTRELRRRAGIDAVWQSVRRLRTLPTVPRLPPSLR